LAVPHAIARALAAGIAGNDQAAAGVVTAIAGDVGRGEDLTGRQESGRIAGMRTRIRGKLSFGAWLPVIWRLEEAGNAVGLTFDDGPSADTTPALLDLLGRHGATATFFVNGQRAAAAMTLIEAIVAGGHDVFPHGWRHVRYDEASSEVLVQDFDRCERLLSRLRPTPSPYLVRLPYGAGHMAAWVHRALRRWNPSTQIAHWELLSRDWALADGCADQADLQQSCAKAAGRIVTTPGLAGSILLLHETPFDVWAPLAGRIAPTLAALLLDELDALGLRAVRLPPLGRMPAFRRFIRG
jgi:peptidoglycan-N-acetylglucosamine deacetylase